MAGFVLRRKVARVVLIDAAARTLLLNSRDPADAAKPPWWELPGGGINPWESSADAAKRELDEEAGITDFEMGPCVWVRDTKFSFGGLFFDQRENIHVAWCESAECRPRALEALEAEAFLGHHWWEVDDLVRSADQLWPSRMREFLPDLVAGTIPTLPIDVGD